MENYIQNPISHPEWNPTMGDFFSHRAFEEDRQYEKKQLKNKIVVSSLLSFHLLVLAVIFFYFA